MTIEQISVFVENKPGGLAEVTQLLADADIDIRALSLADTTDFGILRLIVDDSKKALKVLTDAGAIGSLNHVIAVRMDDKPGSLARILQIFMDEKMFIEYMYAFLSREADGAYVVFRLENNDAAEKLLTEKGFKLAGPAELGIK